ncbi:hypothetical protein GGR55DRAFT_309403 [Xylaria sp. FL0064]|nr:hypothetical protein GGR55DRAFT_309403 [Xylaria sp. FL0064]
MSSAGIHELPTGVNTAEHSTKTNSPHHNAQHNKEPALIPASNDRELSHLTGTEDTTYDSQYKRGARPHSKRKRVASFLSAAFKSLRGAILNYVAPARDGTTFFVKEDQKDTLANLMYNEPGPWHVYGRLDSDNEDDRYIRHCPKKKTRGERSKARRDQLTTTHEDSPASRGAETANTPLRAGMSGEIGPRSHTSNPESI